MKLATPTTSVRVNGELLGRQRTPRPEHYEDDINWLLNDAPGLLGEAGVSYGEPTSGSRVVVDTGPYHARAQAAMWAVRKARRLTVVWRALDDATRLVLVARYAQRRWPAWYVSHFGELVGVVVFLHATRADIVAAAGQPSKATAAALLDEALKAAQVASSAAHRAWRMLYRQHAEDWANG